MMISLSRNLVAVVDDIDRDLSGVKWFAKSEGVYGNKCHYALRNSSSVYGKRHSISMHRVIIERVLGRCLCKGEFVDHIDHDGLNNRRDNLRVATHTQNICNRRMNANVKSSKYKGVLWRSDRLMWAASIRSDGKLKHIGYFDSEEDAARAYDAVAKRIHGIYSHTNFVA
jgi:hypothetical protein